MTEEELEVIEENSKAYIPTEIEDVLKLLAEVRRLDAVASGYKNFLEGTREELYEEREKTARLLRVARAADSLYDCAQVVLQNSSWPPVIEGLHDLDTAQLIFREKREAAKDLLDFEIKG